MAMHDPSTTALPASPRRMAAALAVFLGLGLVIIDGTIVNVGLPVIARSLETDNAAAIWVVNVYQMVLLAFLFPAMAAAGHRGSRELFLGGVAFFTLASLGCALAPSFPALVLARALQALGGAAVLSVNLSLVQRLFPAKRLGRGMALNTATISLAVILGPAVAGFILLRASWPWLFAVNLPLGALALGLGFFFLPREAAVRRRSMRRLPPLPGLSLLFSFLFFSAFFALTAVPAYGLAGWTAPFSALVLAASFVFLRRAEARAAEPVYPAELLRLPGLRVSALCLLFAFMAQSGTVLALPFFLLEHLRFSIAETSLLLVCWPLAHIAASLASALLAERMSPGRVCALGLLVTAAGMLSLCLADGRPDFPDMALRIGLCGLGFGAFQAPNDTASLLRAPEPLRHRAGAMLSFMRTLGQTLGALVTAAAFLRLPDQATLPYLLTFLLAAAGLAAALVRERLPGTDEEPGRD